MSEANGEIEAAPQYTLVTIERPHGGHVHLANCDGWDVEKGRLRVRCANGGRVEFVAGQWMSVRGATGPILYEPGEAPRELSPEEVVAMKAEDSGSAPRKKGFPDPSRFSEVMGRAIREYLEDLHYSVRK